MIPCPSCERFVDRSSRACPFCGTTIRLASAPVGGVASVLLGLTLAACSKEPNDEGTSTVADTSTVTTDDPTATSTSGTGITSLDSAEEAEVAAYAGPGSFDDTTDTFPPDETTSDTDGTDSGSGTGTGTGTGTGAGTGTGTGTGSSSGGG